MPKALIIGPNFHYFNQSVERAFRAKGYETRVLAYDNPIHPYNTANKLKYKFSGDKLRLKEQARALFHLEAELAFEEFLPDFVFVMNGDMLLPDALLHWRGKLDDDPQPVGQPARVALWLFDSFDHIPFTEENIPAVDAIFCYEQTDIPKIAARYGVRAYFLPQAVDPVIYHKVDISKTCDLVFAGDIFHSAKRQDIIQAVVSHYPNLKLKVWGEYKPWYKNPLKCLTREHKDIYMNRNASGDQLNADYNQARIVLNIHIEQQKDGANPKVYEIAATGVYQICDANPYVEQLFPNGEVGLYHYNEKTAPEHRYDELFERIDYALSHDMSVQAEAAREIVMNWHTFEKRIEQVLRTVYE